MKIGNLTGNTDEKQISALFADQAAFSVPYFQRAYGWKTVRTRQLLDDVFAIVDGTADAHFLGAIIIYGRFTSALGPKIYDLIDGQQRVTTIYLMICALVLTLCDLRSYSLAAQIFRTFLVFRKTWNPTAFGGGHVLMALP